MMKLNFGETVAHRIMIFTRNLDNDIKYTEPEFGNCWLITNRVKKKNTELIFTSETEFLLADFNFNSYKNRCIVFFRA